MIAWILAVARQPAGDPIVSYRLYDSDGFVLDEVEHAALDQGWWHAFQPLRRRFG
jgi:hypothetical protein